MPSYNLPPLTSFFCPCCPCPPSSPQASTTCPPTTASAGASRATARPSRSTSRRWAACPRCLSGCSWLASLRQVCLLGTHLRCAGHTAPSGLPPIAPTRQSNSMPAAHSGASLLPATTTAQDAQTEVPEDTYQATFETEADGWTTVFLPWHEFGGLLFCCLGWQPSFVLPLPLRLACRLRMQCMPCPNPRCPAPYPPGRRSAGEARSLGARRAAVGPRSHPPVWPRAVQVGLWCGGVLQRWGCVV